MPRTILHPILIVAASLSLLFVSTAPAKPPGGGGGGNGGGGGGKGSSYEIVRLSETAGEVTYASGIARDVNDTAVIVGQVYDADTLSYRAVCWTVDTSTSPATSTLLLLPGPAVATGINNAAEVVGQGVDGSGVQVAKYWNLLSGVELDLPPLSVPDAVLSRTAAQEISENGVVCGTSTHDIAIEVDAGVTDATGNTGETVLASGQDFTLTVEVGDVFLNLTDGTESRIVDVVSDTQLTLQDADVSANDILFAIEDRFTIYQAVAWRINLTGGAPTVWGPLALPSPADSFGTGLNDNDGNGFAQIVGRYPPDGTNPETAVVWTVESLGDGTLSVDADAVVLDMPANANAVNNSATICGDVGSPTEAAVWDGGPAQILDRAKFVVAAGAHDISHSGVIVGGGDYWRNFEQGRRAVVWANAGASMVLLDKYLESEAEFFHLSEALGVNESAVIVGHGWDGNDTAPFAAIPR